MKKIISDSFTILRLALAMTFAMTGIETLGLWVTHVNFMPGEFGKGLLAAFTVSLLFSLGLGLANRVLKLTRDQLQRLTCLTVGLAMVYLILVLHLWEASFNARRLWLAMAAYALMVPLLAAVGFMVHRFFERGGSDQATARFQAFAPVITAFAGIWSVLDQRIASPDQLAAAGTLLIFLAAVAQYLIARALWGRRRKAMHRRGVFMHLALILAVSLAAIAVTAIDHHRRHDPATAPPGSPNVILISIDTLRPDYLSCYNPKAAPTPVIDSLARDGVRFENAISASCWTEPGVAAFLSGMPASAAGAAMLVPGRPYNYTGILPGVTTLAEAFQEKGYSTMAEVENPWISPFRDFDQGFDRFRENKTDKRRSRLLVVRGLSLIEKKLKGIALHSEALSENAIHMIEDRPDGPFFLWVHYLDPHLPYYAHAEFPTRTPPALMSAYFCSLEEPGYLRAELTGITDQDKQYVRERYEGEVRYNDKTLGMLIQYLKKQGLYDSSLIVLTSDHGEEFWEHGGFEHGHTFHHELLHVPLIVKLPGNREAGKVAGQWVSMTRMGRTMLEAAQIASDFKGSSLLPCLTDPLCGDTSINGRFWISEKPVYGSEKGAVGNLRGQKAMIHADDSITCYDLAQDPREERPFPEAQCPWGQDDPTPREVWEALQSENHKNFLEFGGKDRQPEKPSDENFNSLRDLGYIK